MGNMEEHMKKKRYNQLQKTILKLAKDLLDSDNGVTSAAYYQLYSVMQEAELTSEITIISNLVKATDGRFYVKSKSLDDLQQA